MPELHMQHKEDNTGFIATALILVPYASIGPALVTNNNSITFFCKRSFSSALLKSWLSHFSNLYCRSSCFLTTALKNLRWDYTCVCVTHTNTHCILNIRIHLQMCSCICVCVCVYICGCMCVRVYVCRHMCMCACVHACVCVPIHTCTYE